MSSHKYNYAIIGGGLAGLTLAIRLSSQGLSTILFEKKSYPFHKVCGEYVSKETLPYLKSLGFDPYQYGAIDISRLLVTGTDGTKLKSKLDLGGFGLSRFKMDHALANIAKQNGAEITEGTQIQNLKKENGNWILESSDHRQYEAENVIGAQGKRSNIDAYLKRTFLKKRSPYIGIKYHIKYDQDDDLIALHNFKNGYCGISRIEEGKYCLCYLASAKDLKYYKSIEQLERGLLMQNSFLKRIFEKSEFLFDKPLAINEITFSKKTTIEQGINMIGDSAGMIAPLCGNGMAMAIHSSKLLADQIIDSKKRSDKLYSSNWNKNFSTRLWIGRNIQKTFGSNRLTNFTLGFFNLFPTLKEHLIRLTHGKEF